MQKSLKDVRADINEKRAEKYENALENFSKKEVPTQQPKKKKMWLTLIVLFISIGVGVYLVIKMSADMRANGQSQKTFVEAFSSVTSQNVLITVAVLLSIILLDVIKFLIVMKATTKQFRPLVSAKVSLWGKYYDNITPSATGGQPAQILYLHGKGFSAGLSTAIVFIKYSVNTIVWVVVGCVLMATNTAVLQNASNGQLLGIVGWIGLSLNLLLQVAILSFVVMPKLATKLTRWFISVGHKMRIVKDKEKTMQKALNAVQDFRSSFIIISKRPFHLFMLVLACVAEMCLSFGFPYFIIKMFNGYAPEEQTFSTFISVMGLNAYANFGASMVPTPGGSGVMEGLLSVAFSNMAGESFMWVTFTYRFATYYMYILIGLGITIFNFVRSLTRSRRAKKVLCENGGSDENTKNGKIPKNRVDGDGESKGKTTSVNTTAATEHVACDVAEGGDATSRDERIVDVELINNPKDDE